MFVYLGPYSDTSTAVSFIDRQNRWPKSTFGHISLCCRNVAYGLFLTSDSLDSQWDLLGRGVNLHVIDLTLHAKQILTKHYNVVVDGKTLADVLWDLLTDRSDPRGDLRPKPIYPTSVGTSELYVS